LAPDFREERKAMAIDMAKVDEAVLALLYLTLHDGNRAWKTIDFDALDRLYEQGFLMDPVSRTKSVVLTEKGLSRSEQLAKVLFGKVP
jgi:hypothetical protein